MTAQRMPDGMIRAPAQRMPDGMILLEMAPMDNQRRLSQEQLHSTPSRLLPVI